MLHCTTLLIIRSRGPCDACQFRTKDSALNEIYLKQRTVVIIEAYFLTPPIEIARLNSAVGSHLFSHVGQNQNGNKIALTSGLVTRSRSATASRSTITSWRYYNKLSLRTSKAAFAQVPSYLGSGANNIPLMLHGKPPCTMSVHL